MTGWFASIASRRALWLLYAAILVAIVWRQHPLPRTPFPGRADILPEAEFFEEAHGEPDSLFRADISRTGYLPRKGPRGGKPELLVPGWNPGVHSASKSTPIGADGKVFVGSDGARFAAFTPAGKKIWEYVAPGSGHGIHSSAVVGGNYACFGTYHGYVVCLGREDGRPLWLHRVGDAIGASPVVRDGVLYIAVETVGPPDGYVVALRLADGRLLWRSPSLGNQAHSSPALSADGARLYLGSNAQRFFALDTRDGHFLWQANLGGEAKATPLVHDGLVLTTSWSARLTAFDELTGARRWEAPLPGISQSSPTLLHGSRRVLAAAAGGIGVFDLKTGARLRLFPWSGRAEDGKFPSALALEDSVWIACGTHALCRFSPDGGRLVRSYELAGFLSGMPWLMDGRLFFSTTDPGGLYRLGDP